MSILATFKHDGVLVFDNVLPDPEAYRAGALALEFRDYEFPSGATFRGIALRQDNALAEWLGAHLPDFAVQMSFFRKSPKGQVEPNYIHTDDEMGDWTAILYLNPDPPASDGTLFWKHRETGAVEPVNGDQRVAEWRDQEKWVVWRRVAASFNRLLVFRAPLFHSRAIADNYGAGDGARLIQVMFGKDNSPDVPNGHR